MALRPRAQPLRRAVDGLGGGARACVASLSGSACSFVCP